MHPQNIKSVAGPIPLALSRHLMVEYYDCSPTVLNDAIVLKNSFLAAAEHSSATVIDSSFRHFDPQGVSGFVVISESHFSIHTWPEYRYAAVDIFTCGETVDCQKAIDFLNDALCSSGPIISGDARRGIVTDNALQRAIKTGQGYQGDAEISWGLVFDETKARALHMLIDLKACDVETIRNMHELKVFFNNLCAFMEMSQSSELDISKMDVDNEPGLDILQRMGASSIAAQIIYSTNSIYFNISVCRYIDPRSIAEFTMAFFNSDQYQLQVALRY
ncbi:MAG: adenosylmethionine decarboxylase [Gammaproteobacteria bacterium]|nr:adenosylmethionine decarboxylase [Gammaproteobacteria bacterium]